MTWFTAMEYLCQIWPLVVNTSGSCPHSWLITGFVTRLTRRVPLVEQELLIFAGHLSSPPPIFSGVRITRSLVLCICFVDRCLSFCSFSFGHCVVCSSSTYGFWLPLWYLQTLLPSEEHSFSYIMTRTFQCDWWCTLCTIQHWNENHRLQSNTLSWFRVNQLLLLLLGAACLAEE